MFKRFLSLAFSFFLSLSPPPPLSFSFSDNIHFAKLSVPFHNTNHVNPLNVMKYFYDVVRAITLPIILSF